MNIHDKSIEFFLILTEDIYIQQKQQISFSRKNDDIVHMVLIQGNTCFMQPKKNDFLMKTTKDRKRYLSLLTILSAFCFIQLKFCILSVDFRLNVSFERQWSFPHTYTSFQRATLVKASWMMAVNLHLTCERSTSHKWSAYRTNCQVEVELIRLFVDTHIHTPCRSIKFIQLLKHYSDRCKEEEKNKRRTIWRFSSYQCYSLENCWTKTKNRLFWKNKFIMSTFPSSNYFHFVTWNEIIFRFHWVSIHRDRFSHLQMKQIIWKKKGRIEEISSLYSFIICFQLLPELVRINN